MSYIRKLAALADSLDKSGKYTEADLIESQLFRLAEDAAAAPKMMPAKILIRDATSFSIVQAAMSIIKEVAPAEIPKTRSGYDALPDMTPNIIPVFKNSVGEISVLQCLGGVDALAAQFDKKLVPGGILTVEQVYPASNTLIVQFTPEINLQL